MANDIKLGNSAPLTEDLKPLKVGGKTSAIETAQHGNGARINGDLEVTGNLTGFLPLTGGTIAGDLDIIGDLDITGDITKDGTLKIQGDNPTDISLVSGNDSPRVSLIDGANDTIASRWESDGTNSTLILYEPGLTPSNDNMTLNTTTAGLSTISTNDGNGEAAGLTIDIDGDITLESHTGGFIAKKAGTEFSVAKSAFAGMILGYTTVGIDAADDSYTLTTTWTVPDSAHKVKFVAPPSGVVEIFVSIFHDSARRVLHLGLSDNATYNALDVTHEHEVYLPGGTLDELQINHYWVITSLTPNTAYEYWLGAKLAAGVGGILRWGGNVADEWAPFIMKATALPTATADFAVYG